MKESAILVACGWLLALPVMADETAITWVPLEDEKELRNVLIKESELIDPFSAQLRKTFVRNKSVSGKWMTIWCGEINAKNRMGAYSGWKRFYAFVKEETEPAFHMQTEDNFEMLQIMLDVFCERIPL